MTDLSTRYLGMELRCPLVASSSPLTSSVDGVRALAEAGAGAVILPSLFEEQVHREAEERERLVRMTLEHHAEAQSYLPGSTVGLSGDGGTAAYLRLVEQAATAVDIPVLASLNAMSPAGWASFARSLESAGAAAVELNIFYLPAEDGATVERRHVAVVQAVRGAVTIPVSVKLGPHLSSIADMAGRLAAAGADGIVLFNRYPLPDIDLDALRVVRGVTLSQPEEGRMARAWIALLYGRVPLSLAAATGVESHVEVAKFLLAGADVVMTASAVVRHGPGRLAGILEGLGLWMTSKGFTSAAQVRGRLAAPAATDLSAFERRGYVAALGRGNEGRFTP